MQVSEQHKMEIVDAIVRDMKKRRKLDDKYSAAQHARYLDINASAYSRIVAGDLSKVLSENEWIRVGRELHVDLSPMPWKIAHTAVFNFVYAQLEACQESSVNAINCDMVGIGKTESAERYAADHANVVYIKCRQGITRAVLIRTLARKLGLDTRGRIEDLRNTVVIQLYRMDRPLVILDDAGYMEDRVWLEVKSLYDDLIDACGWYIIGDPSLQLKMEKLIYKNRVGYEAFFDRFNQKFQTISEQFDSESEILTMKRTQLVQILKVNMPGLSEADMKEIVNRCKLSIRTLRKEINKLKNAA